MKKYICLAISFLMLFAAFSSAQTAFSVGLYADYFGVTGGTIESDNAYIAKAAPGERSQFESLDGNTAAIDTALEFALLSYYSSALASERPEAAAAVLPADSRDSEIKLAGAVNIELQNVRFHDPDNSALITRYEKMLTFIRERNDITQTEIDAAMTATVGGTVDGELTKVAFEMEVADESSDAEEAPVKKKTKVKPAQRIIDIGLFDINVAAGQNLLPLADILKETLVLDFAGIAKRIPDFMSPAISVGVDARIFEINYNHPSKGWGFGLTPAVSTRLDVEFPRSIFVLLAEGNAGANGDIKDKISISASAFAEVGLSGYFPIKIAGKNLRIGVKPTYYVPVVYIPKSTINMNLKTDGPIKAEIKGDFSVYMGTDFMGGAVDVNEMLKAGGVDLSISAEYPLFDAIFKDKVHLDVGVSLSNIPIVPASLKTGMKGSVDVSMELPENISELIGGSIPLTTDFNLGTFGSLPKLTVVRPTRFDFYARYRPFNNDLLVLVPNIGFTLGNNAGAAYAKDMDVYFNGSFEVQTHLGKFIPGYLFTAYFNTGIFEGFWHNRLGLALNLRAFELDLEIGTSSTDYAGAWDGSGLSAKVGIRFGW